MNPLKLNAEVLPTQQTQTLTITGHQPSTSKASKAFSINSGSDSCEESCLGYSEEDEECPALDQRHLNLVHEELEKLNIATDVINKLEVQLDAARASFREIQTTWSEKLKELSKKYGSAIAKARPFYEMKKQENDLRKESMKAAIRFEKATGVLAIAKEQVKLCQDSLARQTMSVHPECLEVLNHHIQRVNEAEEERQTAEDRHRAIAEQMLALNQRIVKMEKEHRSAIKKSRQYFEQGLEFTRILEQQKAYILRLEAEVRQKKQDYTTSLRNLEKISDSIHEQRSLGSARSLSTAALTPLDPPANPPPYHPTAPPPYEENGDDRYRIPTAEQDEAVNSVFSIIQEEKEWEKETRGIGSGVILLAQQLIGGGNSAHSSPSNTIQRLKLSSSQEDISYKTLPEGMPSSSCDSERSDDGEGESEISSLSSYRTSNLNTDEEGLRQMLRSHSSLIREIDSHATRIETMLKRSASDTDESGVGSSH
ncbi:unnamed protein product, partial [Mesorhabditis belari]|uniref:SH3 domain-binding protein 5-like n=1 Tax=Mesorhabditis belari TaxID=2138241 RepID=A0AAF3FHZ7_9BILA